MRIFRVRWTVYDSDLAATRVLRFADAHGYNDPTAAGMYFPRIADALLYVKIVSPSPFSAGPAGSAGQIVFNNQDFGLTDPTSTLGVLWGGQSILDFGIAGHPVEIDIGDDGDADTEFETVLSALAAGIDIGRGQVVLRLRDPLENFKRPLSLYEFAGSNTLPTGLEGVAGDLKGAGKLHCAGKAFNVFGQHVNTSRDIYQFGDELAQDLPALYDKGVSKTKGASRTLANIDNGSAPTAGQYDYHLGGEGSPESGLYGRLGTTSQGPITADVEGRPHTNLVLRSAEADNASWTKTNCTVTANAANDSTGAATADKIVEDSTASVEHHINQAVTITAGGTYWVSTELQSAGRTFARVTIQNGAATNRIYVDVNLTTGVAATVGTAGSATLAAAHVADLGSGIYRVAVGGRLDGVATAATVKIQPASALATVSYTGGGVHGIYVARTQFEVTAPTWYQATTAAAVASCMASPADIAARWASVRAGVSVNYADVMKLNKAANADVGFVNRDNVTIEAGLNEVVRSALAKWYLDSDGTFRTFRLEAPAGDPVYTFKRFKTDTAAASTEFDIIDWSFVSIAGIGGLTPVYKVSVGYKRYWMVQKEGLDASITQVRKAELQAEYRWTDPAEDSAVLAQHPTAGVLELPTALTSLTAAESLRSALVALFSVPRHMVRFVSELDPELAAGLRLGLRVNVILDELGYTGTGRAMTLLGMIYNAKTRRFEGWAWG